MVIITKTLSIQEVKNLLVEEFDNLATIISISENNIRRTQLRSYQNGIQYALDLVERGVK